MRIKFDTVKNMQVSVKHNKFYVGLGQHTLYHINFVKFAPHENSLLYSNAEHEIIDGHLMFSEDLTSTLI